jgi:hypothetical protein
MAKQQQAGDVFSDQDLDFQRRSWVIQRIAWGLMVVVVGAGLAGLFGHGPASQSSARAGGLTVEYESAARFQAPTSLRLRLDGTAIHDGTAAIQIDQAYLDRFEIVGIVPAPAETRLDGEVLVYSFKVGQPGDVIFNLKPERIGGAGAQIGVVGGQTARLEQFIYP